MSVDADLFHMLIERLGCVEDEVRHMRSDLGCILLPRLQDVTAGNVDALKETLAEQDIVRGLSGRARRNHAIFNENFSDDRVCLLKANGFRVYRAMIGAREAGVPKIVCLWKDAVFNETMLRSYWIKPEDFQEL